MMGIFVETRNGLRGKYDVAVYTKRVQQFIIDNMDVIIEKAAEKNTRLKIRATMDRGRGKRTESNVRKQSVRARYSGKTYSLKFVGAGKVKETRVRITKALVRLARGGFYKISREEFPFWLPPRRKRRR